MVGNRLKLIGVLHAGFQHVASGDIAVVDIPTVAKPVAVSAIPNNLGIVIKATRLLEMAILLPTQSL